MFPSLSAAIYYYDANIIFAYAAISFINDAAASLMPLRLPHTASYFFRCVAAFTLSLAMP